MASLNTKRRPTVSCQVGSYNKTDKKAKMHLDDAVPFGLIQLLSQQHVVLHRVVDDPRLLRHIRHAAAHRHAARCALRSAMVSIHIL